jgi:TraM recognition site of TraD and TraG
MSFVKDLDTPLLRLTAKDYLYLMTACAGIHIFGGIGSGKTTGPGRMIAGAYLRAGMGGLVTAVKPEEAELWRRYAAEHGRTESLVFFTEDEGFNFLAYELGRQGMEGIGTVTECFMRILEAAKRASPTASQKGGEPFWEDATRLILRYALPLIYSATGTISIGDLIRFISTAPTNTNEVTDSDWQKRSFMYQVVEAASHSPKVPMTPAALHDALAFWADQFPKIPSKTLGNIVITVTTTLDRFKHGRLNRAFCGRTTIVPEMTFHGVIIVLAMPTLTWAEDGVIAQQLFKYMWQRAVLARNGLAERHRERPVFIFSDEAQDTVSSYDGEFLSMCRASKCCVTYLTQSLPAYYSKMGGDNPRDAAHNLVGKFMTHIYHSNACPETNEFASRMIGKVMTRRGNYSSGTSHSTNTGMTTGASENRASSSNSGHSSSSPFAFGTNTNFNSGNGHNSGTGSNWGSNRGRGASENTSQGYSESMEYAIEPGDFARILKNGGKQNGNLVTAIWFQSSRVFSATGTNFMLQAFKQ